MFKAPRDWQWTGSSGGSIGMEHTQGIEMNDEKRKPVDANTYLKKLTLAVSLMLEQKANHPAHPLHKTMYLPLCRWIDRHYPEVP